MHSHSVCMHLSLSMHTASFAYCPPTTTAISLNPCINYLCHLFFFLNFMPLQFFSSPLHHLSLPCTLNMPLSLTVMATIKLVEQHAQESRTAVHFAIQSSRRHVTKKGIKKTIPNKKKGRNYCELTDLNILKPLLILINTTLGVVVVKTDHI